MPYTLNDIKAPKIIDVSRVLGKTYNLNEGERTNIVFDKKLSASTNTIMTFADCCNSVTEDLIEDVLMFEEKPDVIVLLGDNTKHDVDTILSYFSNNYFGYGGIVSETMKIIQPSTEFLYDSNNILKLNHDTMLFKSLTFGTAFVDKNTFEIPVCDVLLSNKRPDWITVNQSKANTQIIKDSRFKLLLHASIGERFIRYFADYDCFVKSCSGIEIFTFRH